MSMIGASASSRAKLANALYAIGSRKVSFQHRKHSWTCLVPSQAGQSTLRRRKKTPRHAEPGGKLGHWQQIRRLDERPFGVNELAGLGISVLAPPKALATKLDDLIMRRNA